VQNSADAEEVAQDTFVKAFQSLRSFRGESKFATWLYRITYFTAINYTRNNKNQGKAFCEEAKQVSVNETVWETKERNAFLKEAMLQLKPQERAIITLFYLEDFSIKEIAEITSLSIANAKVRLHRSRKNLKEILECLLPNETTSIL
jgi:RNA polymerase sigma-70 factor (ECF subfamily)